MYIDFIKMHGCGNDFLVIDTRSTSISLDKKQVIALADYKKSIGFDQLLILKNSKIADIGLEIYNQDGSIASACGNGSRCIAKLILNERNKDQITIATSNRVLEAKKQENMISINMGPANLLEENIKLDKYHGDLIEIGNPHVILNWTDSDELRQEEIVKYGPLIENDSKFLNKVNVNFVKIINKELVYLRTWERGAGSTLACGSGACASFSSLYRKNLIENKTIMRQPGGDVIISIEKDSSNIENIIMTGEAKISYKGIVEI